jgi:hypothetical protein
LPEDCSNCQEEPQNSIPRGTGGSEFNGIKQIWWWYALCYTTTAEMKIKMKQINTKVEEY